MSDVSKIFDNQVDALRYRYLRARYILDSTDAIGTDDIDEEISKFDARVDKERKTNPL